MTPTILVRKLRNPGLLRRVLRNPYILYTVVFILMILVCFFPWYVSGKTFFEVGNDSFDVAFTTILYFDRWVRDSIRALLSGEGQIFPSWDFAIGQGEDILVTLSHSGFTDPFNLFTVFVPSKYLEKAVVLLIFARLWIAGLGFMLWARMLGYRENYIVVCAMVYVLSGYTHLWMDWHIPLLNVLVFFPYVLIGIELVNTGRSPIPFIAAIFLIAVGNFSALPSAVFGTAIFGIWRFFATTPHAKIKCLILYCLKYLLLGTIGILLAGFILVPTALTVIGGTRVHNLTQWNILYDPTYYQKLLTAFISPKATGHWQALHNASLGFSAPVVLAIFCLYIKRNKNTPLKVLLGLIIVVLLLPLFGSVLNGFNYPSNRWTWVLTAAVSTVLLIVWKDLFSLSPQQRRTLFLCVLIYFVLIVLFIRMADSSVYVSFGVLALALCVLLQSRVGSQVQMHGESPNRYAVLFAVLVLGGLFVNSFFCSAYPLTDLKGAMDSGAGYRSLTNVPDYEVADLAEENGEFVRYENDANGRFSISYLTNMSTTREYASIVNGYVSDFLFNQLHLASASMFQFRNLSGSTILNKLASVGYYLAREDASVPYGFEEVAQSHAGGGTTLILHDGNHLPLGYTYGSFLSYSEWIGLSDVEKQEALMQSAVVQDEDIEALGGKLEPGEIQLDSESIDYSLELGEGVERIDEGTFLVLEEGATIELGFKSEANSETYLAVGGLSVEAMSELDLYQDDVETSYSKEEYEDLSKYRKMVLDYEDAGLVPERLRSISLKVESDNDVKNISYSYPTNPYYGGRHDYLVNLGYSKSARTSVVLTLPSLGMYTIDSLKIIQLPFDQFPERVDALTEDVLEDVDFATDMVSGYIDLEKPKLLVLSIPFNQGWSLVVDGEPRELLRVNSMYMGVLLEPGRHDISLEYSTYGQAAGWILSGLGLAMLIGYQLCRHHHPKGPQIRR